MIHELKTWPEFFMVVKSGIKTFEVRKNDRAYKIGDELLLREFDNNKQEYTGQICHRRISYILKGGGFGIDSDTVVLGLQYL